MINNKTNQKDALIKEIKPYLNPSERDILVQTLDKMTSQKCKRLIEFIRELQTINRQFFIDYLVFEKGKVSAKAFFYFDSF